MVLLTIARTYFCVCIEELVFGGCRDGDSGSGSGSGSGSSS